MPHLDSTELTTALANIRDAHVVIWGVGTHGGGLASAIFCHKRGARITLFDNKGPEAFPEAATCAQQQHWTWAHTPTCLEQADLIICSPAIPPRALPDHLPLTCGEAIALLLHTGRRIGVTGTKGKSTTAMLCAHLLNWQLAGNSNTPLIRCCEQYGYDCDLVCELSSFQLWHLHSLAPSFDASINTGITCDHLDWHPNVQHYRSSKEQLAHWSQHQIDATKHATPFLNDHFETNLVHIPRQNLPLLGPHNTANAQLALAAAEYFQTPLTSTAFTTVQALPHRLEPVHQFQNIHFINDSCATNPSAATAAVQALTEPLALIAGGSDKGIDLQPWVDALSYQNVQMVCLIGATASAIAKQLIRGGIPHACFSSLEDALRHAVSSLGEDGGCCMLSPACASFGMFHDYADRGHQFTTLVRTLWP